LKDPVLKREMLLRREGVSTGMPMGVKKSIKICSKHPVMRYRKCSSDCGGRSIHPAI